MPSCLSGGGRAYGWNLEVIKPPTTFSTSNSSSSPSSTLSESTNSPLSIFQRKPRTPRKRPNQTYNEAAAILSTAYPKIFPTKHLSKPFKFTKSITPFPPEPSDLLLPFRAIDTSAYLLQRPSFSEQKGSNSLEKPCQSPGEVDSRGNFSQVLDDGQDDFDAESLLDEEIEQGLDSIMGNLSVANNEPTDSCNSAVQMSSCCYGYPVGLGFDFGYGMRREMRAIRNGDEGDWWRFPCVNVANTTQKISKTPSEKKKKTKKLVECGKKKEDAIDSTGNGGLLLKLNYDDVLNAWSDKGSPFSGDAPGGESSGNDVQGRLAHIDLFPENGAERGAIVLRYKEKRRTRLFSKKIRYQVRKVNADQRPRMKGRFVRTENSGDDD